jgi:two-component system sensor histidine kinase TctE
MNKSISLRQQLLRWLLTLLLPLLLAGVIAAYFAATYIANLAYDRSLFRAALAVADEVVVQGGKASLDLPEIAQNLIEYDKDDFVYYRVTAPDGRVIAGQADLNLPPVIPKSGGHIYYNAQYDDSPIRVAAFSFSLPNTSVQGTVLVQMAETLTKRDLMKEEIIAAMVLPQLLMVILATALLFYGTKRGLLPLNRLRELISQRTPLDLSPVPTEDSPLEVHPLLNAMNDLMKRVRESMQLQQRFIADASHQLRTPVAGLKTQAEMALREQDPIAVRNALRHMRDSSARLAHLITQLLSMARVERNSGRELILQPLDIAQLAREVTADFVSLALAEKIDLGFDAPDATVVIEGDALMLREMLANLLDNAIRYTQADGKITVSVMLHGRKISLAIEDNGCGIPVSEREQVFERFYRLADSPAEGCGLGLAIVREIAAAHRIRVNLSEGADGIGTRVVLEFFEPE